MAKKDDEKRPEKWKENNWLLEASKARKPKSVENHEVNSVHRLEERLVISSSSTSAGSCSHSTGQLKQHTAEKPLSTTDDGLCGLVSGLGSNSACGLTKTESFFRFKQFTSNYA